MSNQNFYSIHGPGTMRTIPPFRIRALRILSALSLAISLFFTILLFIGWNWLASGITPALAFGAALTMTLCFGLALFLLRSKFGLRVFALEKTNERIYFTGFHSKEEMIQSGVTISSGFVWMLLSGLFWMHSFPIPEHLSIVTVDTKSIVNDQRIPVYFWDYSLFIDPQWASKEEVLIPYEKGPPQKLISKIIFRNRDTRTLELELNGKRPRTLDIQKLETLFEDVSKKDREKWNPKNYSLLYWIQYESGMLSRSDIHTSKFLYERPEVLTQLTLTNGIHIYGQPWTESSDAKFFYLSPLGGIFQVHCYDRCLLGDTLSSIQIPPDPSGSLKQRIDFTTAQIRIQLSKLQDMLKSNALETERIRQEGIVRLYLASYLTLNPAAQEAYFHLAKLSKSQDALSSLIRYAKDVRMDPSLYAELLSLSNSGKN